MSTSAASAEETAPLAPEAERAARQARQLQALAELGMGLAADLRELAALAVEEAKAPEPQHAAKSGPSPAAKAAEIALAFSRVSRAVRLTHALETQIAEAQAARERADPVLQAARQEAERKARFEARPAAERRRDVLANIVPDMIDAQAEREVLPNKRELLADCEALIGEAYDDDEIVARSIPELVAAICADLGVTPDWSLWNPADWTDKDWALTAADHAPPPPTGPPRPPALPAQAASSPLLRALAEAAGLEVPDPP